MYKSEGVHFEHIAYTDNQPILDMIEKKPGGLLLFLDDMNRMPRSTDEGFVAKADAQHKSNKFYKTAAMTRKPVGAKTVAPHREFERTSRVASSTRRASKTRGKRTPKN